MERLARRVADKAVLRLVRRYLEAGLMDEVDRELERRGHRFVRYADDCNVYVRSQRAGERVLVGLQRLYDRLHLKVNAAKTAVARATGRKFLGYALWLGAGGQVKRAVAHPSGGDLQATHPRTNATLGRPQLAAGCGAATAVRAGLEGVLPARADPESVPRTRRVDPPPVASTAAQALEARHDDVSAVAGPGCIRFGCAAYRAKQPALVA
jgi:hypothetical protein